MTVYILKCPRCLGDLSKSTLDEALAHLDHCIWCQEMDEKLDSAKRDYKGSRLVPYRVHAQSPDIYEERIRLFNIKLGRI